MTPMQRLLAEEIPIRPDPYHHDRSGPGRVRPLTPEEQAHNRATLEAALDSWVYKDRHEPCTGA